MRYFIEFSYKGTNYHGFQTQPKEKTVQETLQRCISVLLKEKIEIVGAGRTDAGVHAKQMYAHFDCQKQMDKKIVSALNSFLPKDIAVFRIFQVDENLHARFDAVSRSYEYHISRTKNPFALETSYYYNQKLNVCLMNKACEILYAYNDFQCFSKTNTDVRTYNCKIYDARWVENGDFLIFHISADRFLRNMVRAIVGTMIEVGREKISLQDFKKIIESKNRSSAGFSVPGNGLFLTKIIY